MTRAQKSILAFVATLALFYLFGVGGAGDWNAGAWDSTWRLLVGTGGTVCAALVALIIGQKP